MLTKNNFGGTVIWGCSFSFLAAVTIIALLFIMMLGADFILTVPFTLAFGWIPFTWTKFSQLQLNAGQLLAFLLCLGLFTAGMHASCKWLYTARSTPREGAPSLWPLKWTLGITGLLLVLFGAGIACIGVSHQAAWLASFKEPWVREMRARMYKHIEIARKLRNEGIKQNWNTEQMRQKASERVAENDGSIQMVIAVDKNGDWRAILSKFHEHNWFQPQPRVDSDYAKVKSDGELNDLLEYYAQDVRPEMNHEK